jgi:hypothetical protein
MEYNVFCLRVIDFKQLLEKGNEKAPGSTPWAFSF